MTLISRFLLGKNETKDKSNLKKIEWDLNPYEFNTAERVDAAKARNIYRNTDNRYKLAGGLSKPVVDNYTAFVDLPIIKMPNKRLQDDWNEFVTNYGEMIQTIKISEGSIGIWVKWDNNQKKVVPHLIPMDRVYGIVYAFDGWTPLQLMTKERITFMDTEYNQQQTTRIVKFEKDLVSIFYEDYVPPGEKKEINFRMNIGRIPIVMMRNEHYLFETSGHSEIEPIEPYLAAYHDVMKNRLIEDKRSSRKKLVIKTFDPNTFITNNLVANGCDPEATGVDWENFDIYVATREGDAWEELAYLNPGQSAQDSLSIAKRMFDLVVETSKVPEWAFAAKLGASFASAKVQEPAWVKTVNAKRRKSTSEWKNLAELFVIVHSQANVKQTKTDIKLSWDEISLNDDETKSKIINNMIASTTKAIDMNLITFEEARELLGQYCKNLKPYADYEKEFDKQLERLEKVKNIVFNAKGRADKDSDESQAIVNYEDRENNT